MLDKNKFIKKDHMGKKDTKRYKNMIEKMRKSALKPERIRISIQNLPKNQKGENHPCYGKHPSEKTVKKMRLVHIGKKASEETKKKMSLSHKGKSSLPEVLKKRNEMNKNKTYEEIYGVKRAKEIKSKIKLFLPGGKNIAKRPDIRKKLSLVKIGENNPFWNNGSSFEPYGVDFNKKLKGFIKERDGCCMLCNVSFEDLKLLKRQINIHHITYDKKCNLQQNLITLCNSCHGKTHTNRKYWTKFFQSLLSEREGYQYSEIGEIILNLNEEIKNG